MGYIINVKPYALHNGNYGVQFPNIPRGVPTGLNVLLPHTSLYLLS